MNQDYEVRYAVGQREANQMGTQALRDEFLIEDVFGTDTVKWVYTHYDRYMAGGVIPKSKKNLLDTLDPLKSDYFLERREMGIINIGGKGTVTADGTEYSLDYKEALYLGKSTKEVFFRVTKTVHRQNSTSTLLLHIMHTPTKKWAGMMQKS